MSEPTNPPAQETPKAEGGAAAEAPGAGAPKADPKPGSEAAAAPAPDASKETPKPDAKAPEAPKKVVPERYDLKAPEDSALDDMDLEKIASYAKEQGFSQEEAQSLLADQANHVKAMVAEKSASWAKAVANDKEIGGVFVNRSVELAKRVVDRYGSPAIKTLLNKTGYGNHPELVRLLSRIGGAMSEDQLVIANAQSGDARKSTEELFYGSSQTKE